VVLATLLLAGIALGFWPLRTWLTSFVEFNRTYPVYDCF